MEYPYERFGEIKRKFLWNYSDFNYSKQSPSDGFFVTDSESNKIKRARDHGCDKVVNILENKPLCWDNFSNFSEKNLKIFSQLFYFFKNFLKIILKYYIIFKNFQKIFPNFNNVFPKIFV